MSEQIWAVVESDGTVSNVIVADDQFIEALQNNIDNDSVDTGPFHVGHKFVDVTEHDPQPAIGWVAKGKKFAAPPEPS